MEEGLEPQPMPPARKPPLRDRLWSFRALLLVALATLIIGGLTGAGLTALASDDGHGHGRGHVRFEDGYPVLPYAPPPPGRRPWQQRHFYWNDGAMPPPGYLLRPGPLPRRGSIDDLEKRLRKRLAQLEKEKSASPTPKPKATG